jgi:hypothetical protein
MMARHMIHLPTNVILNDRRSSSQQEEDHETEDMNARNPD